LEKAFPGRNVFGRGSWFLTGDGLGFFAVVPGVELDAGKAAYYSQFRVFRTAW